MKQFAPLIDSIRKRLRGDGCGNHRCMVNPPSGQGTNGPCQCKPRIIADELRRIAEAIEEEAKA